MALVQIPHIRADVGRDRVGERRHPDARGERCGLMLRIPDHRRIGLFGRVDPARLDHVEHVAVAVVVVADILLVEVRHPAGLVRRADMLAVPVDDHVLPVGIERRPQHEDNVAKDRVDLGIVFGRQQLVGERHRQLVVGDFAGVHAAVDVDDDLAVVRQLLGLFVGQPARIGQPLRDVDVLLEVADVVGGRDHRIDHLSALGRLAGVEQLDAVRHLGQRLEVADLLLEIGEVAIVAGRVAEHALGCRDGLRRRGQSRQRGGQEKRHAGATEEWCHSIRLLVRVGTRNGGGRSGRWCAALRRSRSSCWSWNCATRG